MNSEQVREGLQQVRAELERLKEIEEAARDAKRVLESTGAAWSDPMGYETTPEYDRLCQALERES